MIKMLDLDCRTDEELKELRQNVMTSNADVATKVANIEAIDSKILGKNYKAILKDIKDGMADIDDLID